MIDGAFGDVFGSPLDVPMTHKETKGRALWHYSNVLRYSFGKAATMERHEDIRRLVVTCLA